MIQQIKKIVALMIFTITILPFIYIMYALVHIMRILHKEVGEDLAVAISTDLRMLGKVPDSRTKFNMEEQEYEEER